MTRPSARRGRGVRAWPLAGRVRPLYVEARFLVHAIRTGLWRSLAPRAPRPAATQLALSWPIPTAAGTDAGEVVARLRRAGLRIHEGGNAFYLPPQPGLRETLGPLVDRYPPGSGFKVLRDFRGLEEAHYLHPTRQTRLRRRLIGTPPAQLVVANYLHQLGLGPRVWDLCVLRAGRPSMPTFVVDHVDGEPPDVAGWQQFMAALQRAVRESELRVNVPDWERRKDFGCPTCNGNLLRDAGGRLLYVDFQNFSLRDPRRLIAPGTSARDTGPFRAIHWALREHGVVLRNRLVVDACATDATRLRQALAAGAWWGLACTSAALAGRVRATTLALGFTRFQVVVADPGGLRNGAVTVPGWLEPCRGDAVVFARVTAGPSWRLPDVVQGPWRALVIDLPPGGRPDARETVAALEASGSGANRITVLAGDGASAPPVILVVRRGDGGERASTARAAGESPAEPATPSHPPGAAGAAGGPAAPSPPPGAPGFRGLRRYATTDPGRSAGGRAPRYSLTIRGRLPDGNGGMSGT